MSYDDAIAELEEQIKQQAAVIEQMRQALQLCRSPMYCHASNTGDNAFDKLCSALTLQPCPEVLNKVRADAKRYRWLREYLPSCDESWDDALVAAGTAEEIDAVIDDAVLRAASAVLKA